jgi:hypothetical protein
MKVSGGFVWLPTLLGILAVLAISGCVWWYMHYPATLPQVTEGQSTMPSSQTQQAQTTDAHDGMSKYINKDFGFSISYLTSMPPEVINQSSSYIFLRTGSGISVAVWKNPDPADSNLFVGPYPKTVRTDGIQTVIEKTLNGLKGVEIYGQIAEGRNFNDEFLYKGKYEWAIYLNPIFEGRASANDYPDDVLNISQSIYQQIRDSFSVLQ